MAVVSNIVSASMSSQLHPADAKLEIPGLVHSLVKEMMDLWWSCSVEFPDFRMWNTPKEQSLNERKLDELSKGLVHELKRMPQPGPQREIWQARLKPGLVDFARSILHLEPGHLDFIETSGLISVTQKFGKMAREFDPGISAEDIFQAGRNVMTTAFIQLMMNLPVEVTPSIFGYSMLYPYTDNYLDDPAVSKQTKAAFNRRFERCLMGERVEPANHHEEIICKLVAMIENQWERPKFPEVYASLLAIHSAQVRSLSLVAPGASPYQRDVLGISFEKGGTSVLADGYLVAGKLTEGQSRYLFGYGAFTQLMDDLEDVETDQKEGQLTVFTQTLPGWKLDGVTNQFFRFGRMLFGDLEAFDSRNALQIQELIRNCLDPILIDIVAREAKHYSSAYLRALESSFPFRFSVLNKQREFLVRQKIDLERLVEAML